MAQLVGPTITPVLLAASGCDEQLRIARALNLPYLRLMPGRYYIPCNPVQSIYVKSLRYHGVRKSGYDPIGQRRSDGLYVQRGMHSIYVRLKRCESGEQIDQNRAKD